MNVMENQTFAIDLFPIFIPTDITFLAIIIAVNVFLFSMICYSKAQITTEQRLFVSLVGCDILFASLCIIRTSLKLKPGKRTEDMALEHSRLRLWVCLENLETFLSHFISILTSAHLLAMAANHAYKTVKLIELGKLRSYLAIAFLWLVYISAVIYVYEMVLGGEQTEDIVELSTRYKIAPTCGDMNFTFNFFYVFIRFILNFVPIFLALLIYAVVAHIKIDDCDVNNSIDPIAERKRIISARITLVILTLFHAIGWLPLVLFKALTCRDGCVFAWNYENTQIGADGVRIGFSVILFVRLLAFPLLYGYRTTTIKEAAKRLYNHFCCKSYNDPTTV